jgi:hypothetical protein
MLYAGTGDLHLQSIEDGTSVVESSVPLASGFAFLEMWFVGAVKPSSTVETPYKSMRILSVVFEMASVVEQVPCTVELMNFDSGDMPLLARKMV